MIKDEVAVVLKKLCEFVGADYDSIDFYENKWFLKHEWTLEQEKEFIEWFLDYLKDKSVFKCFSKAHFSKKTRLKVAKAFVFSYGWKYKKIKTS